MSFSLEAQSPQGSLFSNSAITSHLRELGYPEKSIDSMLRCGEPSRFRYLSLDPEGYKIQTATYHCNLRTCPSCSKIRKRKIVNQYFPFLDSLAQDRTYFLYFLTISPKNYEDLEYGLNHIKKSFSKFLRHNYIKDRIKAGFYVIEAKGTEGNWNIHIHSIVYGRYIDNKVRKNKNSKIVDLFRQSSSREVNMHITKQNSTRFTLNYMCKYISANKDDFKTDFDLAKYIFVTRKKRLISKFGLFYKIKTKTKKEINLDPDRKIDYIVDPYVLYLYEEMMKIPEPLRESWQ